MTFEQLSFHFSPHLGHCSTFHKSLTTLAGAGGCWFTPVFSTLGRLLHEDPHELEVSLGHTVRFQATLA